MKLRKPTEVCITVDTEFSIGGNFEDPELAPIAEPIVLGTVSGNEHALGFLLDCLSEFRAQATFFVEALQTAYFGDEPMGGIARRIAQAGQDVQLHLHPCWLHYAARAPSDSCAGRSDAELDHFFQFGLSAFLRWGAAIARGSSVGQLPGRRKLLSGGRQIGHCFELQYCTPTTSSC